MAVPVLIFVVFVVALTVTGIVADVRRRRALFAMAAAKRWDLVKNDRRLPETFGGQPFNVGHGRVGRIVLCGRHNGRAILVIDYEFKTPGSDGDDTHHYWAACVDDLPVSMPFLEVVPRTARTARTTGPVMLTGAPEFSRGDPAFDQRYLVSTAIPAFAAGLLDPRVLRLLASWPDFSWRLEGTRLLTWGKGYVKPHWVQTSLNMLVTLAETFPDEVWRPARG